MTLNIESKILSFLNLEKKNLQETHLTLFIQFRLSVGLDFYWLTSLRTFLKIGNTTCNPPFNNNNMPTQKS